MKDVSKVFCMIVLGLLIAVIGYPFLHETGHLLAAMCVGAKVCDFQLIPLSYVTCNVEGISIYSQTIIGLSGMVFPLFFTNLKHRNFWMWYSAFVLKGICLLSYIISLIAIICYRYNITWSNEDTVQMLILWNGQNEIQVILIIAFSFGCVIAGRSIYRTKPILNIINYFGI